MSWAGVSSFLLYGLRIEPHGRSELKGPHVTVEMGSWDWRGVLRPQQFFRLSCGRVGGWELEKKGEEALKRLGGVVEGWRDVWATEGSGE